MTVYATFCVHCKSPNLEPRFRGLVQMEKPTGRMGWMAHRKRKETKQQPSMLPGPAVPGCCLVSFHFLWAIQPIRPVSRASSHMQLQAKASIVVECKRGRRFPIAFIVQGCTKRLVLGCENERTIFPIPGGILGMSWHNLHNS